MQSRLASPRLASILAAATLAASIGPAAARPLVMSDVANLRSGPGAKWPVIAQIPAQAKVTLINCGPGWKRDWCHVAYGGKKGYVAASTLAPTAHSVIVAPLVTRDITKLRSGPGGSWKAIASIPPGTKVSSSGCSKGWDTKWCKVTYEGKSGYVDRGMLKRSGAVFSR